MRNFCQVLRNSAVFVTELYEGGATLSSLFFRRKALKRSALGGIFRAERSFSLSFLISSTREITRQRDRFRSARKIPPSGKRPLTL
jgi:hypothetical protein